MKVSAKLIGSFIFLFTFICFQGFCQFWRFVMAKKDDDEDTSKYDFPTTLEDFKYYFNKDGQLRQLETDEPFNFVVEPDNHKYNQKRYEALGNIITEHVYKLLEEHHLKRVDIPVDAKQDEPTSFFYMSEDALDKEKLLILIHGNGVVRAGQWARRLIINDCLDSGTQLPFIDWGIKEGYGVIVANTNYNTANDEKDGEEIPGSESPEEHMKTVWQSFVKKSKAKYIGIVAHSYGGVVTLDLAVSHAEEFWKRVFAVALTDSVHSFSHQVAGERVIEFYKQVHHVQNQGHQLRTYLNQTFKFVYLSQKRGKNWASCLDPLDTELDSQSDYCPTVAAGTEKHEYTSYSSMKSIFKFLSEKYDEMNKAEGKEEAKGSVKEIPKANENAEVPMSQEVSEVKDLVEESSVTKENEEVPMSQPEEDISQSEVSIEENSGTKENAEIPMSQDTSASQVDVDVDMNSQDPDSSQKEEL